MLGTIWRKPKSILIGLGILSFILTLLFFTQYPSRETELRSHLNLEQRIDLALQLSKEKLVRTIGYLEKRSLVGIGYPSYTYQAHSFSFSQLFKRRPPQGTWIAEKVRFWSAGAFPALLWKMYDWETELGQKLFWSSYAKSWAEPLRKSTTKDVTINNLFVFRPWFEATTDSEKKEQLATIFQGAKTLATPYDAVEARGTFHNEIGVMGVKRKATRTDNKIYWQAFIDHIINVEQLLWAAQYNPNQKEAQDWRQKAIQHITILSKTWGKNRNPGQSGTWQRGYFDDRPNSSNYRQFLFNEGKQGWRDSTTWSRGQAWVIYGTSITYQYTQDPAILSIAKAAIDYYIEHLPNNFSGNKRRQNDFIPPWDFDYALLRNPDTERDSSAAAIAVSGMLKLITTLPQKDPDRPRYLDIIEKTLHQLTSSDYLPDLESPRMSLLRQGCYHHYQAIKAGSECDNGLIWGDYFFVDALLDYQRFKQLNSKSSS